MEMKQKRIICFVAFLLIAASVVFAENNSENRLFQSQELREDFDFMLKTLEEVHPNLYAWIPKAEFWEAANRVRKGFDEPLVLKEFYLRITPIVASICDCHTGINALPYLGYYDSGGLVFPFSIKWINGHVYVRDNFSSDSSVTPGTEIVSINGISVMRILDSLYCYCALEKSEKNYPSLEGVFQSMLWLVYDWGEWFEIEYMLPSEGRFRKKVFEGIAKEQMIQAFERIQVRKSYELTILDDEGIAILSIAHFMMDDNEFIAFLDSSFRAFRERTVSSLIIDVRRNPGGKKRLALALMDHLTGEEYSMFSRIDTKTSQVSKECVKSDELYKRMKSADSATVDYGLNKEVIDYFNIIMENADGSIITRKNRAHKPEEESPKFGGNVYVLVDGKTFSTASDLAAMVKDNQLGVVIGIAIGIWKSGLFQVAQHWAVRNLLKSAFRQTKWGGKSQRCYS
jgi:hypothetical protein